MEAVELGAKIKVEFSERRLEPLQGTSPLSRVLPNVNYSSRPLDQDVVRYWKEDEETIFQSFQVQITYNK